MTPSYQIKSNKIEVPSPVSRDISDYLLLEVEIEVEVMSQGPYSTFTAQHPALEWNVRHCTYGTINTLPYLR